MAVAAPLFLLLLLYYYYSAKGQVIGMYLPDGAAPGRYMVCIARHVGPAEKTMPAFSLQQFTTKQDLNGKILACDTRFVKTAYRHDVVCQSVKTWVNCSGRD